MPVGDSSNAWQWPSLWARSRVEMTRPMNASCDPYGWYGNSTAIPPMWYTFLGFVAGVAEPISLWFGRWSLRKKKKKVTALCCQFLFVRKKMGKTRDIAFWRERIWIGFLDFIYFSLRAVASIVRCALIVGTRELWQPSRWGFLLVIVAVIWPRKIAANCIAALVLVDT